MLSKCQAFVNFSVIWGLSSMIFGRKEQGRVVVSCAIDMMISWLHFAFDGNISARREAQGLAHRLFIVVALFMSLFTCWLKLRT